MKISFTNICSKCDVDLFTFAKEIFKDKLHFSILFYFIFLECVFLPQFTSFRWNIGEKIQENVLIFLRSKNILDQCLDQIHTAQQVYRTNRFTGFYVIVTLVIDVLSLEIRYKGLERWVYKFSDFRFYICNVQKKWYNLCWWTCWWTYHRTHVEFEVVLLFRSKSILFLTVLSF